MHERSKSNVRCRSKLEKNVNVTSGGFKIEEGCGNSVMDLPTFSTSRSSPLCSSWSFGPADYQQWIPDDACMDKLITSAVVVKMQTMNLPVALSQPALLFPLLLLLAQAWLIDRQVIASVHWWHDENMKGERNGGREKKKERKKEREGVINWQRYECKFPREEFTTSCAATDCAPLRPPPAPPCAVASGSPGCDRFGSVTSQNMYVSKEVTEGVREGGRKKDALMNQLTTGCFARAGAPLPPLVPSSWFSALSSESLEGDMFDSEDGIGTWW